MGRAFAVSMAFNFMGYPFGAIIAGALATDSLPAAIVLSVIACLIAGVLAFRLIPMSVPQAMWADASPKPQSEA
jgi:alpha/beta superfamily hydrolase